MLFFESKDKEIKMIKESAERKDKLVELMKPLNKEKAAVMSDLLESVQTAKLQSAYEKYLPAVLNTRGRTVNEAKTMLTENRSEITGDKSTKQTNARTQDDINNVVEIKRLAGLK